MSFQIDFDKPALPSQSELWFTSLSELNRTYQFENSAIYDYNISGAISRLKTHSHFSALSFGERCDFCQVLFIHVGRFSILFLYRKIGKLGFPSRLRPPQNAINESVSVLSPHTVPNPFTYKCGLSPNPIVCSFLFLFGILVDWIMGILLILHFYYLRASKVWSSWHRKSIKK